jgi:hypothetical protein
MYAAASRFWKASRAGYFDAVGGRVGPAPTEIDLAGFSPF